jgi:LPS export ABC transporter protein LptC
MTIKKIIKPHLFQLLLAVMIAMPACKSDLETIETIVQLDEGPIESAFNIEIIYSDQAYVRMILNAPQMDRYESEENYLEMPEGLTVVFYDTLMQQTSSMSARYAISYEETEIIEAREDVIVINELGEQLNTEELIWDQRKEIIYSEKFVRITTEDEVTYGEGFHADERFDQWEITNPRGTFRVENPQNN